MGIPKIRPMRIPCDGNMNVCLAFSLNPRLTPNPLDAKPLIHYPPHPITHSNSYTYKWPPVCHPFQRTEKGTHTMRRQPKAIQPTSQNQSRFSIALFALALA